MFEITAFFIAIIGIYAIYAYTTDLYNDEKFFREQNEDN